MRGFLHRSLGLVLAMALVVAGLPMAHAMPDAQSIYVATPMHAAMQHHADMAAMTSADHAHHHADMVMDIAPDKDDDGRPSAVDPCKCLNCSMCVASFVASPMRFPTPERRIVAVTYRSAATGIPGIAVRVDPGIPILAM
jgi:hypothetical protein